MLIRNLNVKHWEPKGITTVADIQIGPTTKTFRSLQIEYSLESKDQYTYTQISHLLSSTKETSTDKPWRMFLYFTNPITPIKCISLFYSFLHQKNVFTKTPSMRTWEIELKTSYTLDQWKYAIASVYKATKSGNLWELYQKILLKWYLTPTRLAGFNPQMSPLCWRQCGQRGSLIHILGTCQLLRNYWLENFNLISHITNSQTPHDASLAILSLE